MITLIVARAQNGAIGKEGQIPWHLPADLAAFKRETLGGAVIMGRRTWESLPVKPLKSRLNIVVTSKSDLTEHCAASIEEAVTLARKSGYQRIYGIGGEGIYKALLPHADRLMLSEVGVSIDGADAFFPRINEHDWKEITRHDLGMDGLPCVLRELLRL